jgi:hypothetical protein
MSRHDQHPRHDTLFWSPDREGGGNSQDTSGSLTVAVHLAAHVGGPDQGLLSDAGPAPEPAGPPPAQQVGLHTLF